MDIITRINVKLVQLVALLKLVQLIACVELVRFVQSGNFVE